MHFSLPPVTFSGADQVPNQLLCIVFQIVALPLVVGSLLVYRVTLRPTHSRVFVHLGCFTHERLKFDLTRLTRHCFFYQVGGLTNSPGERGGWRPLSVDREVSSRKSRRPTVDAGRCGSMRVADRALGLIEMAADVIVHCSPTRSLSPPPAWRPGVE